MTPGGSRGGYGQFCGLARALDLLGGRWALLVVRDLMLGPKRFGELQEGLPGIPTNVLTARLRELEEGGVVERRAQARPGSGVVYALTDYGRELEEPMRSLGFWGAKTMGAPHAGDYFSVESFALALRGSFRPKEARGHRRVYELRLGGKTIQLAVSSGKLTVPVVPPAEPDAVFSADPGVIVSLLYGDIDVDAAIDSGQLTVDGDRAEAHRMFRMFRAPDA